MKEFVVATNGSKAQQAFLIEYLEARGYNFGGRKFVENAIIFKYFGYDPKKDEFYHYSEINHSPNQYEELNLPTFILRISKMKPKTTIGGHQVEFKLGHIKVGCTAVTNQQVRDIVKNLID